MIQNIIDTIKESASSVLQGTPTSSNPEIKKITPEMISEMFENTPGKTHSKLIIKEPTNPSNFKDIVNFGEKKEQAMSGMWGFFLLMCSMELQLKKQSREDSYHQRITSFNDMNHAAEKLKDAAKMMMAGAIIGGALSLGGGMIGMGFGASKLLGKGMGGIGNKFKSVLAKGKSLKERALHTGKSFKQSNLTPTAPAPDSPQIQSVRAARHNMLDEVQTNITRNRASTLQPQSSAPASTGSVNTRTSTLQPQSSSAASTVSTDTIPPALPKDINASKLAADNKLMSQVDKGRYMSILFDNSGRLSTGVFQGLSEIERTEKVKLEAMSGLKQSFGNQEEQYCSSVADTLSKLISQVNSIVDSNTEMFRSAIRA